MYFNDGGEVHKRPRSRNPIFPHKKLAQRGFVQRGLAPHALITAPNPAFDELSLYFTRWSP